MVRNTVANVEKDDFAMAGEREQGKLIESFSGKQTPVYKMDDAVRKQLKSTNDVQI